MARPYDLLAFLNQDTRWENILNLHHNLSLRQQIIRGLWAELERDTNIHMLLNEDDYCVRAGQLNTLDWYTSSLEEGKTKIGTEEFTLRHLNYGDADVPDCKRISSLTFSMCVFEHLEVCLCSNLFLSALRKCTKTTGNVGTAIRRKCTTFPQWILLA